jgi:hypothetical protein
MEGDEIDTREFDAKLLVGSLEIASVADDVPPQLRSVFTDDMLHGDHQVVEFAARGREISDRLDVLGFTLARVRLHCQDPIRAASLLMPLRGTDRQPVRNIAHPAPTGRSAPVSCAARHSSRRLAVIARE